MPYQIIAISGHKQSGKDTVCDILKSLIKPPARCYRIGFADKLKEEVAANLGISVAYLESHKPNFRLILQGYGSDYKRDLISKDYWVIKLVEKLRDLPETKHNSYVIVPDVRFLNEANTLRNLSAIFIRVKRDISDEQYDAHISENELNLISSHIIINNNSTLEELKTKVTEIFNNIIKKSYEQSN